MEDGELHQHTFTYNIEGNKITLKGDDFTETFYGPIHETKDYIKFSTDDGAFYKTKKAAEAALKKEKNQNQEDNIACPTSTIPITIDKIAGKTFYIRVVEDDGSIIYEKVSFSSDGISTLIKEENGNKKTISLPFMIENGKIKIDMESRYFYVTLKEEGPNYWKTFEEKDDNKDGSIDKAKCNIIYLTKPSDFPSDL